MSTEIYQKYGKRIFDIILSVVLLIITTPLMILISALIFFNDGWPVFYTQKRMGKNMKEFKIFKFRTMIKNADKKGNTITTKNDPRILKIGKFLRKYKLDELPQLVNVLLGEMSIVGPRPDVKKYVYLFETDFKEILKVKPGITDFASLKFINEEEILEKYENREEAYVSIVMPQKVKLFKEYVRNVSFKTDMMIILQTFIGILKKKG
jgi:lipopolysaccharide/colanic/teichoic acid biosynthesis glycosyltransferase